MKITLDQQQLAQAVTSHLRSVGVTADIAKVDFRYTRTPYTVFCEVELSEARVKERAPPSRVIEREKLTIEETPVVVEPLVNPETLPPLDPVEPDEPIPNGPATPLFGGG